MTLLTMSEVLDKKLSTHVPMCPSICRSGRMDEVALVGTECSSNYSYGDPCTCGGYRFYRMGFCEDEGTGEEFEVLSASVKLRCECPPSFVHDGFCWKCKGKKEYISSFQITGRSVSFEEGNVLFNTGLSSCFKAF
tara:strand:- start:2078 stop:2485 length:408 start_codon:yes stop_codon:yes gene_type:complete